MFNRHTTVHGWYTLYEYSTKRISFEEVHMDQKLLFKKLKKLLVKIKELQMGPIADRRTIKTLKNNNRYILRFGNTQHAKGVREVMETAELK
jgi:hypothetical protein